MHPNTLAPHELLELHELLSSEVTAAQKLQANMDMVNDKQLRAFMQKNLQTKHSRIYKMSQLVISSTGTTMQ